MERLPWVRAHEIVAVAGETDMPGRMAAYCSRQGVSCILATQLPS